jgi:hypothetical protein
MSLGMSDFLTSITTITFTSTTITITNYSQSTRIDQCTELRDIYNSYYTGFPHLYTKQVDKHQLTRDFLFPWGSALNGTNTYFNHHP